MTANATLFCHGPVCNAAIATGFLAWGAIACFVVALLKDALTSEPHPTLYDVDADKGCIR